MGSAQISMVKRRYVRQKLYQLKVQWPNVAVSSRSYISSKLPTQKQVTHKINPRRRVSHPCRVDLGTQYKKYMPMCQLLFCIFWINTKFRHLNLIKLIIIEFFGLWEYAKTLCH